MAQYPIKMLKDESGKPFVPLTQINAVVGDKYIVSSFEALQASTGHFIITHNHLTDEDILNKVVAVIFPEDITPTTNSYLRLNDGENFLIYDEDGNSPLLIKDFSNVVCFLVRRLKSWQLVKTGAAAAASGSGGHTILDGEGNVLPQQGVLQFKGFGVSDSPGTGATVISTPALVNNLTTASSGTGPLDAYQGKVLNDKFANYLTKDGNAVSAARLSSTIMPGMGNSATGYLHLLTWEITSAWSGMGNIYALTDTEASQTVGTFAVTYRTGQTFDSDGKGLNVSWISGNMFTMPQLTITKETTETTTIIRLYVKKETYRTYRLTTVVDNNDRAVAKTVYSFVDDVTGTVVSTSNGVKASTAAQLNTACTLTIGNSGKSFNGTGNVSWSLAEIGAAPESHSHSYLPLSGGSMTGSPYIYFPASAGATTVDMPMALTYGRLQAYGTLCINADTDGSTTEYLILTAGRGISSTTGDGLAIGYSTLRWRDSNVPTVYVQSGTPSAKQTGDIWFVT